MFNPGWSHEERLAFEATIAGTHRCRHRIELLDLDHRYIDTLTEMYQGGQTDVDTTAQVRRSASVDLFDPRHRVGVDTGLATEGSVPPKYMIQAWRGAFVESYHRWFDIPVFCGPITTPTRGDDVLHLDLQGKESLALEPAWSTYTVKAGTNKAAAIRKIMAEVAGETRFRLSTTTAALTFDQSVTRETSPWDVVQKIATSIGWDLFYDAEGYLVGRVSSSTPVFTFRSGNGGTLESDIRAGYNQRELKNAVIVTGGTPKGAKVPISGKAVAPASHPLSPENLARGGVPQHKWVEISDDTITTKRAADLRAEKELADLLLEQVSLEFDSMVTAHLQEWDVVQAIDEVTGQQYTARQSRMSIPWGDGSQSNGQNKLVSRSSRRLKVGIRR